LVFLETTVQCVHRVGETAENQRKTREKSKVTENQVFWLDFCAKEKNCEYPLRALAFWWRTPPQNQKMREIYIFCLEGSLEAQIMG
jgi:hypothetical protein